MHFTTVVLFLASAGLLEAAALERQLNPLQRRQGSPTCLAPTALQTGSQFSGQEAGTEGIKEGQASSLTDDSNFINFCDGQTLTNGEQNTAGSCNGIPMGQIPATTNMISAVILEPRNEQVLGKNESFTIRVQTQNLNAGSFTNPTTTYYTAPQQLDDSGNIIGHCHVTVQDLGALNPTSPPDPTDFAFFLGIDDAGNGAGLLEAPVDLGLLPGRYRVCTMIAAMNHQPVNMPVAQRGAQDDCVRFQVVENGAGGNGTVVGTPSLPAPQTSAPPTGQAGSSVVAVNTGTLGGTPPAIVASGDSSRPFAVEGNTFPTEGEAVQRVCDIQFNLCADAFNRGELPGQSVSDCQAQKDGCGPA